METETKQIKYEVYKIAWYMRGGVSADDLLYKYSIEDREIMNTIVKENVETTNKSGLPLI